MSTESEDYEIMPHKDLINLKEELKKLRTKGGQKTSKADMDTMETLNASIQELLVLFKEASKDMKTEEGEEAQILHRLTDAIDMMNTIVDQNEKIAEGIVTVAEMIKDHFERHVQQPSQPKDDGTVLGVPVLGTESEKRPARQPDQSRQYQQQAAYAPQQQPAFTSQPAFAPQQQPAFASQSPPQQQPAFAPQQRPAFPPQGGFPGQEQPAFGQPSPFSQQKNPISPFGQPFGQQPETTPSAQDPFSFPSSPPFSDNPFSSKPDSMDMMPPPPAPPPPPPGMASSLPPQRSGFLSRFK